MDLEALIKSEISECEMRLYAAMRVSDVDELDALISDELLFVGPSGEMVSKAMDLEMHRSGGIQITQLEPREQEMRVLNDAVVATTKVFVAGVFQGNSFASEMRYTRVWRRTESGWKILAGHCGFIA
jgi:ketosteroid isomerase-like protein